MEVRRAMSETFTIFGDADRICGQIAVALHHSEFQIYATLALLAIVGILLFPPRDDPDQI
jgi:hypothetical protein